MRTQLINSCNTLVTPFLMTQNILEGLIGDIISRANFRPTLSQKDTSSSFSLGEKNHHVTTHRSVTRAKCENRILIYLKMEGHFRGHLLCFLLIGPSNGTLYVSCCSSIQEDHYAGFPLNMASIHGMVN